MYRIHTTPHHTTQSQSQSRHTVLPDYSPPLPFFTVLCISATANPSHSLSITLTAHNPDSLCTVLTYSKVQSAFIGSSISLSLSQVDSKYVLSLARTYVRSFVCSFVCSFVRMHLTNTIWRSSPYDVRTYGPRGPHFF